MDDVMDIDTGEKETPNHGSIEEIAMDKPTESDDQEDENHHGKGTKRKEPITASSETEHPLKKRRVIEPEQQHGHLQHHLGSSATATESSPPNAHVSNPPIPSMQSEDKIISFLIDGKKVATFQSTLTKIPNTKICHMFSASDPGLPKVADCYLLERPRKAFTGVLNYLRTGKFYVPKDLEAKADLEAEIEYWGLIDYYKRDAVGWAALFESSLLEKSHQRLLNEWYGKADQRWKLLYKASRDGWEALNFHKKCDRKGPTMTIISANGFLFGGYTPLSWESRDSYAWDESSWIFSLTNPTNEPVKMANIIAKAKGKELKYSIYDASDHGPTFGGGYDIAIQSNANTSNQNYTNVGYSYLLPGKTFGEESKNFMTGSYYFSATEIEVFGLSSDTSTTSTTTTNTHSPPNFK